MTRPRLLFLLLLFAAVNASAVPLRFVVTHNGDSGPGSLRAAIESVNNGPCAVSACWISFSFTDAVIALESPLPIVKAYDILIDGGRGIALDGTKLTSGNGLDLNVTARAEVDSLTIRNFPGNGILLRMRVRTSGFDPSPELKVSRCVVERNQRGVNLGPAGGSGSAAVYDSIIAENVRSGLFLSSGSRLLAEWNWIAGNGGSGIFLDNGVGGMTTIAHNVIERNHDFGIAMAPAAGSVRIRLNSIAHNGGGAIDIGLDGPNKEWPWLYGPRQGAVLEAASYDPETNTTTITGTLDDMLNNHCGCFYSYAIALYSNEKAEHGEYAEAETYLGEVKLTAGRFVFTFNGDLRGRYVTALPTRWYNFDFSQIPDTVELSNTVLVQ